MVLLNCRPGNGSYAIENCGPDCHVVVEVTGDNAIHDNYDESNLVTDDSQLPAEVSECLLKVVHKIPAVQGWDSTYS